MASITKRGNNYKVTVSNGRDGNGKQILESKTFRPDPTKTDRQNQKDLERFVLKFEEEVHSGKYLDGEKTRFNTFVKEWKNDYSYKNLEKKTQETYETLLKTHILPVLGNMKMAKIQPHHLSKFYNELATKRKDGKGGGYSAKTIKHIHNLISCIFSAALKQNVISDNPCERVTIPKVKKTSDELKYFTLEQTQSFINYLNEEYTTTCMAHDRVDDTGKSYHVAEYSQTRCTPTQFRLFFLLAIFGGMRRGEIIALEWSDFDFTNACVSITKSTTVVKGKPLTKAPKTNSSIRLVSLPPFIMDLVKTWRKEQLEYRMIIGSKWKGSDHVFIQWNGTQMHPDTPYKTFKKIIKRYNENMPIDKEKLPEIPLHGLRHTSATLLISQNVDVKTVSGRLGHSQTSTTMDIYAHVLKEMDKKASNALDNLFSKNA